MWQESYIQLRHNKTSKARQGVFSGKEIKSADSPKYMGFTDGTLVVLPHLRNQEVMEHKRRPCQLSPTVLISVFIDYFGCFFYYLNMEINESDATC